MEREKHEKEHEGDHSPVITITTGHPGRSPQCDPGTCGAPLANSRTTHRST